MAATKIKDPVGEWFTVPSTGSARPDDIGLYLVTAQEINAFYLDLIAMKLPEALIRDVVLEMARLRLTDGLKVTQENISAPAVWR